MRKKEITFPEQFSELFEPKRYKIYYGGRGSTKSWSIAGALVIIASQSKKTILCTREIQNSIKDSVYRLICDQIERYGLSDIYEIQRDSIRCTLTGSIFIFKGLYRNHNSIKSIEGIDIVWIEEAQSISQESIDFLVPTIRKDGSEIWMTFNPDQEDDPVYSIFVKNDRENAVVKKVNMADVWEIVPDTLKEEYLYDQKHNIEKWEWIWNGSCRKETEAQIFKGRYSIEDFEIPSGAQFNHGMDFGFAEDPSTVIQCYIIDNILYISKEAYGLHVSIDQLPKMIMTVTPSNNWQVSADSSRPDTIDFIRRHGYPNIRGCKKGKNSIMDGIEKIRSFDRVIIHPRCKHTIDEFRLYSFKTNAHTGEIMPVPEDKNNHIIDALRYSLDLYGKTYTGDKLPHFHIG